MRSPTAASAGKTSARWRRGIGDRCWWRATCGVSSASKPLSTGGKPRRRSAATLSGRALLLVVNRLTAPGSEHGLARWLETDFVCDRQGRLWLAKWRDDAERIASRTPRVRVALRQLKHWYRTLD